MKSEKSATTPIGVWNYRQFTQGGKNTLLWCLILFVGFPAIFLGFAPFALLGCASFAVIILVSWLVVPLQRKNQQIVVYSDRIEHVNGATGAVQLSIPTSEVQRVALKESQFAQQAYGIVLISHKGSSLEFNCLVEKPRDLFETIISVSPQIKAKDQPRGLTAVSEPINQAAVEEAKPSATTIDISEPLQQLNSLREQGILTEAEFEAKKKELLDRI